MGETLRDRLRTAAWQANVRSKTWTRCQMERDVDSTLAVLGLDPDQTLPKCGTCRGSGVIADWEGSALDCCCTDCTAPWRAVILPAEVADNLTALLRWAVSGDEVAYGTDITQKAWGCRGADGGR